MKAKVRNAILLVRCFIAYLLIKLTALALPPGYARAKFIQLMNEDYR